MKFRFSLRLIFILITLICIGFSWKYYQENIWRGYSFTGRYPMMSLVLDDSEQLVSFESHVNKTPFKIEVGILTLTQEQCNILLKNCEGWALKGHWSDENESLWWNLQAECFFSNLTYNESIQVDVWYDNWVHETLKGIAIKTNSIWTVSHIYQDDPLTFFDPLKQKTKYLKKICLERLRK